MKVDVDKLFQTIGKQQVMIDMLQTQITQERERGTDDTAQDDTEATTSQDTTV